MFLKMLIVPTVLLVPLTIIGVIYKWRTGKPFIVFGSGKSEIWIEKPDDKIQDTVQLEEIEGLWAMVSVGRNGNFAPPNVIANNPIAMAIVGNTFTLTQTLELSTVTLNNDVIPNQLDQTAEDGDTHLCIVRIRNGLLEICQAEPGKPRPVDFAHQRVDGASLTLFQKTMDSSELDNEVAEPNNASNS